MNKHFVIIFFFVILVVTLVCCDTQCGQEQTTTTICYNVSFDANGGTGNMDVICLKTGESQILPSCTFVPQLGYKFGWWNTKIDDKGDTYQDKSLIKDLSKIADETVVLYAQWIPKDAYVISYGNLCGVDNSVNPKTFTETQDVLLQPLTRKYYTFDGWFDALDEDKQIFGWSAGEKTKDVVLYAKWSLDKNTMLVEQTDSSSDGIYHLVISDVSVDIEAIAKVVNALKDIPIDLDLTQCTELQSIPENTFSGLQNLVAISLPISVKTIGAEAFNGCKGLTHIALGLGITSIGSCAFLECSNLKRVDYNGTIEQWCNISFENNMGGEPSSNPLVYAGNLYINNELLKEITIPETVTDIKLYSFYGCTSLSRVTIPDSVHIIRKFAFCRCTGLTTISIGEGVETIEDHAFAKSGATEVTIGSGVTCIQMFAFQDCHKLTKVYYKGTIEQWCNITFGEEDFLREANPLFYAHNLYINDQLVENLIISDTVNEIKRFAFYGCSCSSVEIGSNVSVIGKESFAECKNLLRIDILDNVPSIGAYAFYRCDKLQTVKIGKDLTIINNGAFDMCGDLQNLTCKATTPPTFGIRVFPEDSNISKIYVPSSSVESYKTAEGWSNYATIIDAIIE